MRCVEVRAAFLRRKDRVALMACILLFSVQVAFSQSPKPEDEGFFGPKKKQTAPSLPADAQQLEIIDGAKNPELIPEIYRWDRFRIMVLNVQHRMTAISLARARPQERPYHGEILTLLGDKFNAVADLARRSDAGMRRLSNAQNSALGPRVPTDEYVQRNHAYIEDFKKHVLALLDDKHSARVRDYVSREAVKQIRWAKLPPRQ